MPESLEADLDNMPLTPTTVSDLCGFLSGDRPMDIVEMLIKLVCSLHTFKRVTVLERDPLSQWRWQSFI